jgi:hypothetical protein
MLPMAEDGQQFHGDACLVSVPITALQDPACAIQFVPPLPDIKRQAIEWCVRAPAWHNQLLLDLRILDVHGCEIHQHASTHTLRHFAPNCRASDAGRHF